jgi:riboflavin transporter FmnP
MTKATTNPKTLTTKITVTAMLTAVAVALQYIEVSIPLVPSFLKLDFSDLPELIGAFVISPLYGVIICALKNIIHLPMSGSMFVGEFSNFILGAAFVFIAGTIYKYKKTKTGALIACVVGALSMAAISVVTNYFIVYPVYAQLWAGGDMEVIISMYKALLPASDTLIKSLLIFNLPFTFVKGMIVAVITMFIYKPLSNLIVSMNNSFNKKKQTV